MTPQDLLHQLTDDGIPTDYVESDGIPAVERVCATEEETARALTALDDLVRKLHGAGIELWTPLHFDVTALGQVAETTDDLIGLMEMLGDFVLLLHERELSTTRALQYGLPNIGRTSRGRPWPMRRGLELGIELAHRGVNPGETLNHGVVAIDLIAGEDDDVFADLLRALRDFILVLDERGIGAYYPIMAGVATAASAHAESPGLFRETLQGLTELATSLWVSNISPYPIFEYGITSAFEVVRQERWLLPDVLPLAIALAAHGTDPQLTLQHGFQTMTWLGPERGRAMVDLAHRLSEHGADAGFFFAGAAHTLTNIAGDDTQRFEGILERVEALVLAMHSREMSGYKTFQEALSHSLIAEAVEESLDLAIATAQRGIDPGPTLQFGVSAALRALSGRPEVYADVFRVAHAQLEVGLSPWRMLENGVPAVAGVTQTDDAFRELLTRLHETVVSLHQMGADTGALLMHGIYRIAQRAKEDRSLFESFLDRIESMVGALQEAGLDPLPSVSAGLPAIAEAAHGAPWAVSDAFELAGRLAGEKVDPAPLMSTALPALLRLEPSEEAFETSLERIAQIAIQLSNPVEPLEKALADLALTNGTTWEITEHTLEWMATHTETDPTGLVRHCLPEAIAATKRDLRTYARLVEALDDARERVDANACQWALPRLINVAGTDTAALASGAESLAASLEPLADADTMPLLNYGCRAAAEVAGHRLDVFTRLVDELAGRLATRPAFGAALEDGATMCARVAGADADAFLRLLEPIRRLAAGDETKSRGWMTRALPVARVAADSVVSFEHNLAELLKVQEAGVLKNSEEDAFYYLQRMTEIIRNFPALYTDLIIPTLFAQGPGSTTALSYFSWWGRRIADRDTIALLRQIVTQHGVRAPDILGGLIYAGMRTGIISDPGAEKDTLLAFLEDVPFSDPEYYSEYRRITTDVELSAAQRRERIDELQSQLAELSSAIVSGEVSEEQERHALFSQVLYYVFPPAYSVSRDRYRWLYNQAGDHPDHVAQWMERGELTQTSVALSQGAYHVKEYAQIDLEPWEELQEIVRVVNGREARDAQDPKELGAALFGAWIEGHLGRERTRTELFERIYQRYLEAENALPEELDDASALLAYRELLADATREIIQEALAAHRDADPSYEQKARNKLAPRRTVGRGLVRSVAGTLDAHRRGDVDEATTWERIERQLRGFDVTGESIRAEILAADEMDLHEILEALPAEEVEVTLGDEHNRILHDLAGPQLAAMQRELFGDSQQPGKLEYRRAAGGPSLALRFEISKRRAHAAVGYNQGVCTAADKRLWSRPEFLQVIFWGPDDRALGGMHLLIIEHEDEEYLCLPGINPSLNLLKEVGDEAFVDAALAFAQHVVETWNLAGIWIPAHRNISSNRAPIRQIFEDKEWEKRDIPTQTFSYSPYAYSFHEVWVVPPPSPSPEGEG